MIRLLVSIGGLLVLLGIAGQVYTRIALRPPPDVDELYHEFQEKDPHYKRYLFWYRCTLAIIAVGVLVLFALTLL
ncbi:MAG: hypothetical protein QHH07_12865 [Sedimentisphaerales bacterium]|nr:hypothetical protein [Sedimentisphaerales bacterium]